MTETKTPTQTKQAPATEEVTVKPGRTHVHERVLYDGDAADKKHRTFRCRKDQAYRLRSAGVVE